MSTRWLTVAAFVTWAAAGFATRELTGTAAAIWITAFLAYGVALGACMLSPRRIPRALSLSLLVIQTVAGLTMVYVGREVTAAATLVVVAAQLGDQVSRTGVWIWLAGQTAALAAILTGMGGWTEGLATTAAFAGFEAFAVAAMSLVHRERAAREHLTRANAELLQTRALLAENTRVAERLRIARDLHDTLGHHLTGLSLQLDLASRLADGAAADKIREAHAITRLLLSDVRDVVSRTRDTGQAGFGGAIRMLAAGVPGVAVHIDMPDDVDIPDPGQAQALLRCVQEIITNTARHAGARSLWIRLASRDEGIVLDARDDGRGADAVQWGNGLTGMRERFDEYAGRIDVRTAAGRGFEIHGVMPRPQAAR